MLRILPQLPLFFALIFASSAFYSPLFANETPIEEAAIWQNRLVENIEFVGNDKTRNETLLQELTFGIGDEISEEDLTQSKQAILNLSLFNEASVAFKSQNDNTVIVSVKEKRYTFILPRLARNGDGDITIGATWRSDNLNGLNQTSKLTAAYKEYNSTNEDNAMYAQWEFDYPRIVNTHYSFQSDLAYEYTTLDETLNDQTGTYTRDHSRIRLQIGEWAFKQGPSRGLRINGGWLWQDYQHSFVSGARGILPNRRINALILGAEGFFTRDLILSRSGMHYGMQFTLGDNAIGSQVDYTMTEAFYRRYHPVSKTPHTNINYQISMAHITRSLLGPPQFEAAGSSRLRGYDRDDLEGNSYLVFNLEYLRPINENRTVRAAALFDAGNAWLRDSDIDIFDLRYTLGFGLRWKIKSFVKTDLRIDVAHGLSDEGKTRLYVGTSSTF